MTFSRSWVDCSWVVGVLVHTAGAGPGLLWLRKSNTPAKTLVLSSRLRQCARCRWDQQGSGRRIKGFSQGHLQVTKTQRHFPAVAENDRLRIDLLTIPLFHVELVILE